MWAEVAALRLLPWTPDQGAQVQSWVGATALCYYICRKQCILTVHLCWMGGLLKYCSFSLNATETSQLLL